MAIAAIFKLFFKWLNLEMPSCAANQKSLGTTALGCQKIAHLYFFLTA
jgi:hypothetical protein